ncbi:MAG: hypothetical protein ABSB89_09175 [Candidatus Bathyarchaeia archaeon]
MNGCVLTYHFESPRTPDDSLYVCLSIPSMKPVESRSLYISEEQREHIPSEIRDTMSDFSSRFLIDPQRDRLEIKDYEFELGKPEVLSEYNASVDEILNFVSRGTDVALELLDDARTKQLSWTNDKELADTLKERIDARLTSENERNRGFHFVCNSMCFGGHIENYLRGILNQSFDGEDYWALGYLYELEKSGNIKEAFQRFLPVTELNPMFFLRTTYTMSRQKRWESY